MVISDSLDRIIRTIPDFPKKGIDFKDITSLLLDAHLADEVIDVFIHRLEGVKIDAIVGVESRGFLFGFLLANRMKVPFVPIRKVGKLPGDTLTYKYNLEYGSAEVEIHKNDIKENWNVLIHDDLLATGGTASAAAELVLKLDANVVAFAFIVNLAYLDGDKVVDKYTNNIVTLIDY